MRRWRAPPWWLRAVVAVVAVVVVAEEEEPGGEFVAGSFILTQKALDEAPYRYSTFLTEVNRIQSPNKVLCCHSAVLRIRIRIIGDLLDPDLHGGCESGSRREKAEVKTRFLK